MSEYINGGSGILTSIGWVDLEAKRSQNFTAKWRHCWQSTVLCNRFLSRQTELRASSDGSRLMGEPPYHLRKTPKCASTWIFTMKTHSSSPWTHGFWRTKTESFAPWAWTRREEREMKEMCVRLNEMHFKYYLYTCVKFTIISLAFHLNLHLKSQTIKAKHYSHQL